MTPYFCRSTMCTFVVRAWWGVGQDQSGAFHSTSSRCWNNRHNGGRYWHKPALKKSTLKTYLQKEEKLYNEWVGSVFCDRSHRRFHKLSEFYCRLCRKDVSVLTHSTSALSRDPTFCKGSAAPTWDSWVACPWVQWQASDGRWAGEAAWEDFAGSLGCSGQRIPVPWELDSGYFRKHWPSTSWARTPAGRELRVGWTSVGAVCLDGQPS